MQCDGINAGIGHVGALLLQAIVCIFPTGFAFLPVDAKWQWQLWRAGTIGALILW